MIEYDYLLNASAVESRTIELINLTPLMMHGWQLTKPNPKGGRDNNEPLKAELRTQSFKGVLRYWWRALQHSLDIRGLSQQENQLFGGVAGSGEQAGTSSKLWLKLTTGRLEEKRASICPHNHKGTALAIKENSRFNLVAGVAQKDQQVLAELNGYLELILMVAGFGQRSRRGAGALQPTNAKWENIDIFRGQLHEILKSIGKASNYQFPATGSLILTKLKLNSDINYPVLQNIWVGRPFNTGEEARIAISNSGHLANPGGRPQYLGTVKGGRQASPLHATVRKIGERYYPIVSEVHTGSGTQSANYRKARAEFLQHVGVN